VEVGPLAVDLGVLQRGRERYDIYCAPCHGLAGYGDGSVAKRAEALQEGTWTPPTSFHTELIRQRPDGHIFNTISNGIRNMPAYGPQIPVADRWAIVAYVRALQRSQNATVDDVPPEIRAQLR
jgi:mono/diheme cytochrome c family protein